MNVEATRVLVLVVDGLSAGCLGPYGNTWIETPALNQFAVESWLAQQLWAPSDCLALSYSQLWRSSPVTGPRPSRSGVSQASSIHLFESLRQHGVRSRFVSDDRLLLDHPLAQDFDELSELVVPVSEGLTIDWQQTYLAQAFAAIVREIEELPEKTLLWTHLQGLGRIWDAPWSYRQKFAEDDDPEPSRVAEVPHASLPPDVDPDVIHPIQCAYAGQIELFNQCIEILLQVLQDLDSSSPWCAILLSSRGFPLGQHGYIGWQTGQTRAPAYTELLHVPCFVRYPHGVTGLERGFGLAEFGDLSSLVLDWFTTQTPSQDLFRQIDSGILRNWSISQTPQALVLRTPAWIVRFTSLEESKADGEPVSDSAVDSTLDSTADLCGEKVELYLQPDDWQLVNDVAVRCPQVVEAARNWRSQLPPEVRTQPCQPGLRERCPPLPRELLEPLG